MIRRNFLKFCLSLIPSSYFLIKPIPVDPKPQKLYIRIKDNGVERTLIWNASFRSNNTVLPTTTIL